MLVDRRKFLNLAAANTVATAMHPLESEQNKKQWPAKSTTAFAFQPVDELTYSRANLCLAIL
jgi:hypothetical protein